MVSCIMISTWSRRMIKAACLTSSPPVTTCRCCLSKSSTLVYRTTGCCGGPRRLPSHLRSTWCGQVGHGVILTLTSSALHWFRPRCVILTHGLTLTLTPWCGSMMPKQPRFWIGSLLHGSSCVADDLQTPGLTRSVDWRSAESVSWNTWLGLPASTPPPSPSGQLSIVPIELCSVGSARRSGPARLNLSVRHRDSSGDPLTHWWAVVEFRRPKLSAPRSFTVISTRRSPTFARWPTTLRLRRSFPLRLASLSTSVHWPLTTWVLPSACCQTSRLRHVDADPHLQDCVQLLRVQYYASCAAFVGLCCQQYYSCWSWRWCCPVWIIATAHFSVYLETSLTGCSRWSMLQHGLFALHESTST